MSLNEDLQQQIEHWFAQGAAAVGNAEAETAFYKLRAALEAGELRSAEPDASLPLGWRVNAWVKRGILLGFRLGHLEAVEGGVLHCVDKHTYPTRTFTPEQNIRIVTGGSAVRAGAYLASGVVVVPPAYINTGAYVD
jgi:2,3,4,5-tetrahydropyridine-2-carboxylate N-succinyltransferase